MGISGAVTAHLRSNVVGYVALFIALTGTVYAASGKHVKHAPANSVVSRSIKDGQVKHRDVHANAVDSARIADGSVTKTDLGPDAVDSSKILDGTVANSDLGPDAVDSSKILDGTVANSDLGPDAVDSSKILDASIGGGDLGSGSVSADTVLDGSLTGQDVENRGLSDSDIGSPAQISGADIGSIPANSCLDLQINFGSWQVGELIILAARDGRFGGSGLFFTPLVSAVAGSASGRVCNVTTSAIDPPAEDLLAWSLRQ